MATTATTPALFPLMAEAPQQTLSRNIEMLNLDGTLFTQQRSVPRGSNWPSNIEGNPSGPPRPAVIGIRRKESSGRFV